MSLAISSAAAVLGWVAILNIVLLLVWAGLFIFARPWMVKLHSRWFRLSPEVFDAMHYAGMGLYKIGIWMFLIIPYLVLRFLI